METGPKTESDDHARGDAAATLAHIRELMARLRATEDNDARDDVEREIREMPLSLRVRDDWRDPSDTAHEVEEFELLLSTGGPAVRIYGRVRSGSADNAQLEYQNWFTPWTPLALTAEERADVLDFANIAAYFGDF